MASHTAGEGSRVPATVCWAAILAVTATLAACGDDARSKLDTAQVQTMIANELEESDIDDATVTCPAEVVLKKDDTFTCDVTPEEGDDFSVEVTQRDADGKIAFDIPVVLLERDDIEKAVAKGVSEDLDETMTADCSDDFEEDEQIVEAGDELDCSLVGENGTTAEARVTVDPDDEQGFTFALSGEPVATTSTTTTTTTTTTTIPATTTTEAPIETDPVDTQETSADTEIEGETVFFDGFSDNSSGWLVTETPGLTVEIDGETYTWVVEPEPETDPLPFEAVPEAIETITGLDDVDVSVRMSFLDGSMGGVSCLSSVAGSYVFAVGSDSLYIAKIDDVRNQTQLVSELFTVDASETFIEVRAECFPTDEGVQLNLEVDGEVVASFEDTTDPHTTGVAGLFVDFDRAIPVEERLQAIVVFDDFEVLQF